MATLVADSYYHSENRVLPYKWASVEVLKFGKYSAASGKNIVRKSTENVDVWAFGVALWYD